MPIVFQLWPRLANFQQLMLSHFLPGTPTPSHAPSPFSRFSHLLYILLTVGFQRQRIQFSADYYFYYPSLFWTNIKRHSNRKR